MKALVALVALTAIATAADLTASLDPLTLQPRSGAPEWVEVTMTSKRTGIREGVLEIESRADGETLYLFRTQELAFAGMQKFRFLLPTSGDSSQWVAREWRLHFLERGQRISLGKFEPPPVLRRNPTLILASVRSVSDRSGEPQWQALRTERVLADGTSAEAALNTLPALFEPADLPVDPLGYCAFDAVQIEGAAFAALRERQMTALAQWVEAGGRLCVIADHAITTAHLRFLQGLAGVDPNAGPLTLSPEGVLQHAGQDSLLLARASFGKLVVSRQRFTLDSAASKSATMFLWGLPPEGLRNSEWVRALRATTEGDAGYWFPLLTHTLSPTELRLIPVWTLGVLFAVFMVLVGPVEYWALGKLRRRILTWLAFPCTSIALTFLIVRLAESYLGGNTHRANLFVIDIGPSGKVVRQTRVHLALPSRKQRLTSEARQEICTPLRGFVQNIYAQRFGAEGASSEASFPTFTGQFPARYDVSQPMNQWQPEMQRFTSLQSAEDTSGIPWERFNPKDPLPEFTGTRGDVVDIFDRGSARINQGIDWIPPALRSGLTEADAGGSGYRKPSLYGRHTLRLRGSFTAASPGGFAHFRDLPCVEALSAKETFVQVSQRKGHHFYLWRRLYLH